MINQLLTVNTLSNRFFAMRHGHSEANESGLVISDPKWGVSNYGLSPRGRFQVEKSVQGKHSLDADTWLVSSDFKRAMETTQLLQELLQSKYPIRWESRLRERFFGQYDRGPDIVYPQVWERDSEDPWQTIQDVESANAVMTRATELVIELDRQHLNANILLVAHGDILQILQTAFAREDASRHRQLKHLETAEIRALTLSPE
ncbi:MAG: histidine phosphatase family protein [bacterium]